MFACVLTPASIRHAGTPGAVNIYSETIRAGTQLRYAPYVNLVPEVRAFSAMRECLGDLVGVGRELSGVGPG